MQKGTVVIHTCQAIYLRMYVHTAGYIDAHTYKHISMQVHVPILYNIIIHELLARQISHSNSHNKPGHQAGQFAAGLRTKPGDSTQRNIRTVYGSALAKELLKFDLTQVGWGVNVCSRVSLVREYLFVPLCLRGVCGSNTQMQCPWCVWFEYTDAMSMSRIQFNLVCVCVDCIERGTRPNKI